MHLWEERGGCGFFDVSLVYKILAFLNAKNVNGVFGGPCPRLAPSQANDPFLELGRYSGLSFLLSPFSSSRRASNIEPTLLAFPCMERKWALLHSRIFVPPDKYHLSIRKPEERVPSALLLSVFSDTQFLDDLKMTDLTRQSVYDASGSTIDLGTRKDACLFRSSDGNRYFLTYCIAGFCFSFLNYQNLLVETNICAFIEECVAGIHGQKFVQWNTHGPHFFHFLVMPIHK